MKPRPNFGWFLLTSVTYADNITFCQNCRYSQWFRWTIGLTNCTNIHRHVLTVVIKLCCGDLLPYVHCAKKSKTLEKHVRRSWTGSWKIDKTLFELGARADLILCSRCALLEPSDGLFAKKPNLAFLVGKRAALPPARIRSFWKFSRKRTTSVRD